VVEITAAGREAAAGRSVTTVTLPGAPESESAADAPSELLDRLRRWRRETATAGGVPAYVIFHDSTLAGIAAARPASLGELLRVSGVGEAKLRRYGEEVLEVLRGAPA
jgi:ATP-dependent DNA helicase RecQ